MKVTASNFKAYDIRGIVGKTVDEAFAEHLGRAFGSEAVKVGEKAVAVGRDGRLSGPGLAAALIRGLASTGLDVVDLGAVTTPMLYFVAATRGRRGCHSGIMVTGSHNPKDYNGFKMVLAGRAIYGNRFNAETQHLVEMAAPSDMYQLMKVKYRVKGGKTVVNTQLITFIMEGTTSSVTLQTPAESAKITETPTILLGGKRGGAITIEELVKQDKLEAFGIVDGKTVPLDIQSFVLFRVPRHDDPMQVNNTGGRFNEEAKRMSTSEGCCWRSEFQRGRNC